MKTQMISNPQKLFKTIKAFCLILSLGLMTSGAQAQTTERTVTGIVKSLDGPVPFATVMLKDTTIGVSANENGVFTFPKQLKENDVLTVTSLGYENDEVIIKGDATFITPFLEDIPLVIIAALRTQPSAQTAKALKN